MLARVNQPEINFPVSGSIVMINRPDDWGYLHEIRARSGYKGNLHLI